MYNYDRNMTELAARKVSALRYTIDNRNDLIECDYITALLNHSIIMIHYCAVLTMV